MIESHRKTKSTNNPYLPNIKNNHQTETDYSLKSDSRDFNKINNLSPYNIDNTETNRQELIDFNEDNIKNKDEKLTNIKNRIKEKKEKDNKIILPNISNKEIKKNVFNRYIRLNNSYDNLNNNNKNLYTPERKSLIGKIKISNFYSTSEIILLVENIINELNLKKGYSFTVKDSSMEFIFNNAEDALTIYKRIHSKRSKNKYYQNLLIDLNFENQGTKNDEKVKRKNDEIKIKTNRSEFKKTFEKKKSKKNKEEKREDIKIVQKDEKQEEQKEEKKERKMKKIKIKENEFSKSLNNKIESLEKLKSYNNSRQDLFKESIPDKSFEVIYKNYLEYFKQRKEERRKKELNYKNGKNISLLASTPYFEDKKGFQGNLRNIGGDNIAPARFENYIDKASVREGNYKDNHLYEVLDFLNHWQLREDTNKNNSKKWISPAKFQI